VTTPTINGVTVEELMPAARDLALQLDRVPACNEIRRELRVGYERAKEIQARLEEQARRFDEAAEADPDLINPEVAEPAEPGQADAMPDPQATVDAGSDGPPVRKLNVWPLLLLALPASVAIWSGWVGLGGLTGFGVVHPLPGIWDGARLNTAITLPIGVEAYAAYALRAWLATGVPVRARRFAKKSAIGSLLLGALGQVAFHLMAAAHMKHAPWWITTLVACLPVGVLGMGAALAHLLRNGETS
jgi:hypothetical protein